MLYRRNKMCSQECFEISEKIQKSVWETREWKSAGNINIYKSVKNEVSTRFLIHDAEKYSNKVILYPTEKPTDNVVDVDLIIVPGLVFDERGARYGRGRRTRSIKNERNPPRYKKFCNIKSKKY